MYRIWQLVNCRLQWIIYLAYETIEEYARQPFGRYGFR